MQEQMSDPGTYGNTKLGEGMITIAAFNSITIKEKVIISLLTKAIPWFLQDIGKLWLVSQSPQRYQVFIQFHDTWHICTTRQ
jgi:predicted membrane channel-forming protein YqfA (hemolysin III family)